jgi:hypothetical protein
MQRLRGRIYLEDGALQPRQLTPGGRHVLDSDAESWHLLLSHRGRIAGCMRCRVHENTVSFNDLAMAVSPLAQCPYRGPRVRAVVQQAIDAARTSGIRFAEIGGWALDRQLRGSTAALHLIFATYSLGQLLGDAIGVSTATMRNGSATILCRIGGEPLDAVGTQPYYDPLYGCEMQLLRFDSRTPNPTYLQAVYGYRAFLVRANVVSDLRSQSAAAA